VGHGRGSRCASRDVVVMGSDPDGSGDGRRECGCEEQSRREEKFGCGRETGSGGEGASTCGEGEECNGWTSYHRSSAKHVQKPWLALRFT
jgi:hypothetical protein